MRRRLITLTVILVTLVVLSLPVNSAPPPMDMCDWISKGCEREAAKVRQDCEYRNEGEGTGYSSCGCQAVRAYKACMDNYGCSGHPRVTYEVELNKDCFVDQ